MGSIRVKQFIFVVPALVFLLLFYGYSHAATIKLVPSNATVKPGENMSVDVVVDGIPQEGLNGVQFRLNAAAPGAQLTTVQDLSQAAATDISIATPLLMSPATAARSGLGDFFYNAAGPNGILALDNEAFANGSALFTYAHTYGATRPVGGGTIARVMLHVGETVEAESFQLYLTDVMLLDGGIEYPLTDNQGTTIQLRCLTTVPDLTGMTLADAQSVLSATSLALGNVYEIRNDGTKPLGRVLEQSARDGDRVLCDTPVDIAINTAPPDVTLAAGADKISDESGAIVFSWTPSTASDTAGYKIYKNQTLYRMLEDPQARQVEVSGLVDGAINTFGITAFDSMGNESAGVEVSASSLDDVPPSAAILDIIPGAYYATGVAPGISASDAHLAEQALTLNGQPYTLEPIVSDGAYRLFLTVKDAAGNMTTREVSFVIDQTPPKINVSGLSEGAFYNNDRVPDITVEDANPKGVECKLDGTPYSPGSGITSEGGHELTVTAEDMAGNRNSLWIRFSLDKTMPSSSVEIGQPKATADGVTYITGNTGFSFSADDTGIAPSGISKVEYKVDSAAEWSAYASAFNLQDVSEGQHILSYRAVDLADNQEGAHESAFVIDNTPPVTTIIPGDPGFMASSGTLYVTDASRFTLAATDNLSGVASTEYRTDGGAWTVYAPFTFPAEGVHIIEYRSTDNVGNVEPSGSLTVIVDKTPPVSSYSFENHVYNEANQFNLSADSIVTVTASDELSGVEGTYYSFDDSGYTRYSAAFRLSDLGYGSHTLDFYSADNVGNRENEQTVNIVLVGVDFKAEVLNVPRVLVFLGGNGNPDKDAYDKAWMDGFLKSVLAGKDAYYTLVSDKAVFIDAFRSGIYNIFVVIDQTQPFDDIFMSEMIEAVNSGAGLLVSGWGNNVKSHMENLLGVDFMGSKERADNTFILNMADNPLCYAQVLTCSGKVLRTALDGGTLAGIITEGDVPNPVKDVTLGYAGEINKGDIITVTLANAERTIDAEQINVTKLPLNSNIPDSPGGLEGNLTISGVSSKGLEMLVTVNGAQHYCTVAMSILRAGQIVAQASGNIDISHTSALSAGMKAGEYDVLDVTRQFAQTPVKETLPGVVLNEYGLGKTVFMAFNLADSAKAADTWGYAGFLRNTMDYLLPKEEKAGPEKVLLTQTEITLKGCGLDMLASEALGSRLVYTPLFDLLKETPLDFYFTLKDGETYMYRYFVRLPDRVGDYSKDTDVSVFVNGVYKHFDRYNFSFRCEDDSYSIFAKAVDSFKALQAEHPECYDQVAAIIFDLDAISAMPENDRGEIDRKIHRVIMVIRSLEHFATDVSEQRLLMDKYLMVLKAKYFLSL